MLLRTFFICFCLSAALSLPLQAQSTAALDSMRKICQTSKNDSVKALTLGRMAFAWRNSNPDSALLTAQKALELAGRIKHQQSLALAYLAMGASQFVHAQFEESRESYLTALRLFRVLSDTVSQVVVYNNLAGSYNMTGKYVDALDCYQTSYKLSEATQNRDGMGTAMVNIGGLYRILGKMDLAEEYLQKAIKLSREDNKPMTLANAYNTLGIIESERKNLDKALEYYKEALAIAEKTNYKRALALFNTNLAKIYHLKNDTLAFFYYERALRLSEQSKDLRSKLYTLSGLARLSNDQKNHDKAEVYAQQVLTLAQNMKSPDEEKLGYELLYECYKAKGDWNKALFFHERYTSLKDSLFNTENSKSIANLEATLALEKKQKELDLMAKDKTLNEIQLEIQAKQLAITQKQAEADKLFALAQHESDKRKSDSLLNLAQKKQLEADFLRSEEAKLKAINLAKTIENQQHKEEQQLQRIIMYLGLFGLLSIALFAFYAYRNNLTQKSLNKALVTQQAFITEQNKNLEHQNFEIKQGIKAATIIQNALLPFESRLQKILKDHFVLFLPHSIVSGDFYWIEKVENTTFVVVADCTGHGVQGAFMSLIGINILERIVLQQSTHEPDVILEKMNSILQQVLHSDEAFRNNGMDVAVAVLSELNENTVSLSYSGAHRPIYLTDSSQTTAIQKISGTRRAIGGKQNIEKKFEKHFIQLSTNSLIYMASDGLADQNNHEGKKLGEQAILKTLEKCQEKPLAAQHEALKGLLARHQGNMPQRDDILFLGIKI
ncbi:MAG: hypothetical protein EAZ57_10570 [Cytophagales bacterium]|nr:MAG: hypothetical protein EAZ67_10845 [Cytophagales bacterium]TAF59599.1 MAG: hypothetical protein EAZ57_10570 [Cytophagales bacterium]